MATQTLTVASSTLQRVDSSNDKLQAPTSKDMAAVMNLASLQRIRLRASISKPQSLSTPLTQPPANSLRSQFDSDSDSESDSPAPAASARVRPACLPAKPVTTFDSDSDDDVDWDISKIKYTGGVDLTPCCGRRVDAMSLEDHVFTPGTPVVERPTYQWDPRPSSSVASYQDIDDEDDDFDASEVDYDEVCPDEMDSDDFPHLHTWPHSWIWNPSPSPTTSLPSIHFHFVESQPPDQSAWTPLQDQRFGTRLTVPGHRAFNTRSPPQLPSPRSPAVSFNTTFTYVPNLGRCVVHIPSIEEQEHLGVCSVPDVDWSSGLSRKQRRQSQSQPQERGRSRAVRDFDDSDQRWL